MAPHPVLSVEETNPAIAGLSEHDRNLFCKFAAGPSVAPSFPTVLEAFEYHAKANADEIAIEVVGPDGDLLPEKRTTYADLNRRADVLAAVLRRHGVSNGDAVGLFVQRSVEMVVGILASLKVGACYVPQHVGVAPKQQLLNVVKAADISVVLTLSAFEDKLPNFDPEVSVLALDKAMKLPHVAFQRDWCVRNVLPSDRCYIIFTSGTTGTPKGVQVTHENVANILMTPPMNLGMRPGMRVSQILSVAFDMGAWEILGAMSNGATLVIRGRSIANAVKHADVVISTPTVLGSLDASEMTHVKRVAVAGEPCPRPLADAWGAFCDFYNSCGPTEVTIVNTAKLHELESDVLTIGKPTPNNTVYVLHPETREPCRIGEVGEMWGGGLCVTDGYLGRPDLTQQRFVTDPFLGGSYRMYKTGDLGRWTANGELEHFGRVDDQVKIKGFRLELDGVSSVMESTPGVTKAVALKVGDALMGFVSPASASEAEVKARVGEKLPYYCVPARVYTMDDVPKNANGKADKRRLHEIVQADLKQMADSEDDTASATSEVTVESSASESS